MSTHKMPRTHTHLHTQIHFTHRMSACTCTHILTHICTVSHPAPHCKRAVCSPVGGKYCVRVHTHTHTLTYTHIPPPTHTRSHTHTHTHTHTYPPPPHTHTHTHSHAHSHTHIHTYAQNATQRPTVAELSGHPWVQPFVKKLDEERDSLEAMGGVQRAMSTLGGPLAARWG